MKTVWLCLSVQVSRWSQLDFSSAWHKYVASWLTFTHFRCAIVNLFAESLVAVPWLPRRRHSRRTGSVTLPPTLSWVLLLVPALWLQVSLLTRPLIARTCESLPRPRTRSFAPRSKQTRTTSATAGDTVKLLAFETVTYVLDHPSVQ